MPYSYLNITLIAGDGDKQERWCAAAERRPTNESMSVQAGVVGGVGGGQVVAGAALRQGPVPRVPGEHHRRRLPHADGLSR